MKLRTLSFIAGAIALSLTATPFAVKAETTSSSPLVVAQVPEKEKGPYQNLGLTDAQKAQIAEIKRNTRAEMEKMLTPEQLETLKTARQNRQGRRDGFASLNLTEDQKTQMRQLMQSKKTQIEAVLTEEQKQQLQQFRQQRRDGRKRPNS